MDTYVWGDSRRYNSYSGYFKRQGGGRMQKLSIDAGFSCPNRGVDRQQGGCTFCNNNAFNPSYCQPTKSIAQQIDEGIEFHERRYRHASHYMAYFQAYSNTYAPLDTLRGIYSEALKNSRIDGLVISTRPDCIDERKLDMIATLCKDKYVAIEYGIESCYDATLKAINRGHDFEATRRAVTLTAQYGIHCGGHLILGLPHESRRMILDEVDMLNDIPINMLKLHQLQILKGSAMEQQALVEPATADEGWGVHRGFAIGEYVELVCDFLERLRPDIMMERFAGEVPPRFQAFPDRSWRRGDGRLIRNEEIPTMIEKCLAERQSWQGRLYST